MAEVPGRNTRKLVGEHLLLLNIGPGRYSFISMSFSFRNDLKWEINQYNLYPLCKHSHSSLRDILT